MSVTNLGLGSVKTFDRDGNETLESQNATSVFLLSHLVGESREQARIRAEVILGDLKGMFLEYSFKDKGHLQRNTDLLHRQPSYKGESSEHAYSVGSFELISGRDMGGPLYNNFVSHRLGLELGQIENQLSINYRMGLILEIKEGSKIILSQLGDVLTDFIAGFIETLKIDVKELETLEEVATFFSGGIEGHFTDILAKLPENFDETEKEKLLFSISQSVKGNKIYFTDLTPIHPDFLHELLKYLDERFGG